MKPEESQTGDAVSGQSKLNDETVKGDDQQGFGTLEHSHQLEETNRVFGLGGNKHRARHSRARARQVEAEDGTLEPTWHAFADQHESSEGKDREIM